MAPPVPDGSLLAIDFLDEEVMTIELLKRMEMYFHRASNSPTREMQDDVQNNKARIGILFVTP